MCPIPDVKGPDLDLEKEVQEIDPSPEGQDPGLDQDTGENLDPCLKRRGPGQEPEREEDQDQGNMTDLSLKGKDQGQDPEKGENPDRERKIDLSPKEKDLGQDLEIGESPDQEIKIDLCLKGRGPDLDLETQEVKDQGIIMKIFLRVWNKDGKIPDIDQGQGPETGDIKDTDRVKEKDQVGLILEIAGDHILERKK